MQYTYEVPLSIYNPLEAQQDTLYYALYGTANGAGGEKLQIEDINVGDTLTWRVPIAPGVNNLSCFTEFSSKVAYFRADDGPSLSYEPLIYPVGYNPNWMTHEKPINDHLSWSTFTIEPLILTKLMTFSLNVTVKDVAKYNAWVKAGKPSTPIIVPPKESHEERTLRLISSSGLIPALMKLSGAANENELISKAVSTDTWNAMLVFVQQVDADRKSNS